MKLKKIELSLEKYNNIRIILPKWFLIFESRFKTIF